MELGLADFRVWHQTDFAQQSLHVCYWGNSGRHLLAASIDARFRDAKAMAQTLRDALNGKSFPSRTPKA
jgi:hypothetical protein